VSIVGMAVEGAANRMAVVPVIVKRIIGDPVAAMEAFGMSQAVRMDQAFELGRAMGWITTPR
jgi:hypothetical protein